VLESRTAGIANLATRRRRDYAHCVYNKGNGVTARIFLAGATGVIGRSLVPLLRSAGHTVVGTTRTSKGDAFLKTQGV